MMIVSCKTIHMCIKEQNSNINRLPRIWILYLKCSSVLKCADFDQENFKLNISYTIEMVQFRFIDVSGR